MAEQKLFKLCPVLQNGVSKARRLASKKNSGDLLRGDRNRIINKNNNPSWISGDYICDHLFQKVSLFVHIIRKNIRTSSKEGADFQFAEHPPYPLFTLKVILAPLNRLKLLVQVPFHAAWVPVGIVIFVAERLRLQSESIRLLVLLAICRVYNPINENVNRGTFL